MRYEFFSDNTAGIAPEAAAALMRANQGYAPSYGADSWSERAADQLRALFDCDAQVFFTSTGTAANALALAALCPPHQAVLCHRQAHVFGDEAGAPIFFGNGLAVTPIATDDWKICPEGVRTALESGIASNMHIAALSLANASELGALYTNAELEAIGAVTGGGSLGFHIDGARLANAVAAGLDPKRLVRAHIDVVAVGGAKAGMAGGEALVFLTPRLAHQFETRLKQTGQLAAKARFSSAQWVALLESGAWLSRAAHANRMAALLAGAAPFPCVYPVSTNVVFLDMTPAQYARLGELGWAALRYGNGAVRFMCSWATTEADIDELAMVLQQLV